MANSKVTDAPAAENIPQGSAFDRLREQLVEVVTEEQADRIIQTYRDLDTNEIQGKKHPTTGYMKRSGMRLVLTALGIDDDKLFRELTREMHPPRTSKRKPRKEKAEGADDQGDEDVDKPAKKTRRRTKGK